MERTVRLSEITPVREPGPRETIGREPFTRSELEDRKISHPSTRHAKYGGWIIIRMALLLTISVVVFIWTKHAEWMFFALAFLLMIVSRRWSPLLEYKNFFEWNRPDIFVGWNYSKLINDAFMPTSRFVGGLCRSLRPSWGCVFAVPLPESGQESYEQAMKGERGVFMPCVEIYSEDWKSSITWILSQTRAAIFVMDDIRGEGIQWEVSEAIRVLGSHRVLFVMGSVEQAVDEIDGSEESVVVVDGKELDIPEWTMTLTPPVQGHPYSETEAKILDWCSRNLPVDFRTVARTLQWYRFYDQEPRYMYAFVNGYLTLFATGCVVAAVRWFQS